MTFCFYNCRWPDEIKSIFMLDQIYAGSKLFTQISHLLRNFIYWSFWIRLLMIKWYWCMHSLKFMPVHMYLPCPYLTVHKGAHVFLCASCMYKSSVSRCTIMCMRLSVLDMHFWVYDICWDCFFKSVSEHVTFWHFLWHFWIMKHPWSFSPKFNCFDNFCGSGYLYDDNCITIGSVTKHKGMWINSIIKHDFTMF